MKTAIKPIILMALCASSAIAGGSIGWDEVRLRIAKSDPELVKVIENSFVVDRSGGGTRLGPFFGERQGERTSPYEFGAVDKKSQARCVLVMEETEDNEFTGRFKFTKKSVGDEKDEAQSAVPKAEADPSLIPHRNQMDGAAETYSERLRILADLDGDGVEDLLLSGGSEFGGTAGLPWTVYLNRGGRFASIGDMWAHPRVIAIEPDQDRGLTDAKARRFARIWVYLKSSGRNGSFGYFRVGNQSVDAIKAIEIYPGDGGTDLGRGIYEATFKQSPIPFKVQQSKTSDDGRVTWSESARQ